MRYRKLPDLGSIDSAERIRRPKLIFDQRAVDAQFSAQDLRGAVRFRAIITSDIFDPETACRLKRHVFAADKVRDPTAAWMSFRAAEPSVEALLRNRGFLACAILSAAAPLTPIRSVPTGASTIPGWGDQMMRGYNRATAMQALIKFDFRVSATAAVMEPALFLPGVAGEPGAIS